MPAGRKPTPNEVKRRLGNPGKRALPERTAVVPLRPVDPSSVPEPLRPLGRPGQDLWNRVWETGAAWISPDTDLELLQVVCEQVDERQLLRVKVMKDGHWRERAALRALDHQVVIALSLLGLTPADRTRLGVAEVQAQSTLDRLRAQRAQT